ncbi:MAG TPA: hybrid sensor histidine kinase/response regulator [Rhizobacter sp.]|nr:hybrid sensor histidine kinase/response regulator [Rhizobacter sp.]
MTAEPSRVKCLLVDDLAENLQALSALLRRDDVELLLAQSGPEALELLLAHDVALAFIDVQMPEMDGFQLAETMRSVERTRDVPIIFVTAGGTDRGRQFKGYDSGAVDFLFKPIEPHILKSKAEVFFQLYRQKQQLAFELQERTDALRMSEMFNAVLGHDLRGPLSAIQLSAKILEKRPDESLQKMGERLMRSAAWMGRMIEDMLDLTRSRLGEGIPIHRSETDFGPLVQGVIQEQEVMFPEARIEFSQSGDLAGWWDQDRLVQVASNLIGNALHHGAPEGVVRVRLEGREPDRVALSVENEGHIAPDLLPHIFDPFRSGRRAATRTKGLGLGLYIVQQVVLAHGGRIEVQSPPGQLTRFTVTLPRQAD